MKDESFKDLGDGQKELFGENEFDHFEPVYSDFPPLNDHPTGDEYWYDSFLSDQMPLSAEEQAELSAQRVVTFEHRGDPKIHNAREKYLESSASKNLREAELAVSRKNFVSGADTTRALSQSESFKSEARKNVAQARFIAGAETQRTRAQTDLNKSEAVFTRGPKTYQAISQAKQLDAQAQYISHEQSAKTRSETISNYFSMIQQVVVLLLTVLFLFFFFSY